MIVTVLNTSHNSDQEKIASLVATRLREVAPPGVQVSYDDFAVGGACRLRGKSGQLNFWLLADFICAALRSVRCMRSQIVVVPTTHHANVLILMLLRASGAKPIIGLHDIWRSDNGAVARLYTQWLARLSWRILTFSEYSANRAKDVYPDQAHKVRHVPLYFEVPREKQRPPELRQCADFDVLFFGRFTGYKGLEEMPHIIKQLGDMRVVLAGTGSAAVAEKIRLAGDEPRKLVVIDRYVSDEEVAYLFDAAEWLALPYIDASQSGVLVAAAPFKARPVVLGVGGLVEQARYVSRAVIVHSWQQLADRIRKGRASAADSDEAAGPEYGSKAFETLYDGALKELVFGCDQGVP